MKVLLFIYKSVYGQETRGQAEVEKVPYGRVKITILDTGEELVFKTSDLERAIKI